MKTTNCPICGTPGIPDYQTTDVVCPHCGSDLKIYKTLADAANCGDSSAGRARKFKFLAVVLPVAVAIILGIAFFMYSNKLKKSYQEELTSREASIAELKEEVKTLTDKLQSPAVEAKDYIDYIVVNNDGPWCIIRKVFGDTSNWAEDYKQIAIDNGFWDESKGTWNMIHPGQVLRIKTVK